MPQPHDPAALSVHLPAVGSRGARIAIRASKADLGFREAGYPEPGFGIVSVLGLNGRLDRLESGGFRLRARLAGELRLECVRCLGDVGLRVDDGVDLVWLPASEMAAGNSDAAEGGEQALEASDMNVSFYNEDRLDLRGAIWEQLHLALPVKPLCAADCAGLCPDCGADRNRSACDCAGRSSPKLDGPLAGLRALTAAGRSRH